MNSRIVRKIIGAIFLIGALVIFKVPAKETIADATINDFEIVGTSLLKYTGTDKTVSVPDSVTVIGDEAFADNSFIETVNLPDTIEKISYASFSGCNNLKEINIPDSVSEIGTAAFCNCSSLSSFAFGSGVKDFGSGVFAGCKNLTGVNVNSRFLFENGAIYDKDKSVLYELLESAVIKDMDSDEYVLLTNYNMPNSVESIKPYAFYGCKNIKEVSMSNSLDEIPAYSFSYCNAIDSIKIPMGVKNIDVRAFQYCINLQDVEMFVPVSFIHETAFDGCPKLNVIAPEDSYAYNWFKNYDKSEVNIIDTEDNGATDNIIEEDELPVTVPVEDYIGETVIVGRSAVFFIDNSQIEVNGALTSETVNDVITSDESDIIEDLLTFEGNGKGLSIPKFAVIDDVIAGKAFYNDESVKGFEFPEFIKSIGDFAFSRSAITEAYINEGCERIGYGAFYHCNDLATVTIPESVKYIEASAFDRTKFLNDFYENSADKFLIVGDGILLAYKGLDTYVKIPSHVKCIGPQSFKGHNEIQDVEIPDSVNLICEEAFADCSNLKNVLGGMNVELIEDRAFANCPVNTIRLVDSVKTIGAKAFDLTQTSLPNEYRCVVFHGNNIPSYSYVKTTTRLTNASLRDDAFSGVNVCIVPSEDIELRNTILDSDKFGFTGLICVITSENTDYANGKLKIIGSTLTKEDLDNVDIPSTVYIYDKGYNFDEIELANALNEARGIENGRLVKNAGSLEFASDDSIYTLSVVKNVESPSLIDAYKRIYGDSVPVNLNIFDVSITDNESGVGITKLGLNTAKVNLALPENVPTSNIHVITMDEYGQLEDIPYSLYSSDDEFKLSFDISHTGTYGIYGFDSTHNAIVKLDDSPDTGDWFEPKIFLSLGLLAIGLALIFMKKPTELTV